MNIESYDIPIVHENNVRDDVLYISFLVGSVSLLMTRKQKTVLCKRILLFISCGVESFVCERNALEWDSFITYNCIILDS